jgi:hypothetical protein
MASARPRHTYADYLGVEMMKPGKHEFFDGEIYAMSGGSEDHAALAVKLTVALDRAVGDGPCRVCSSDLRIYVEAGGRVVIPSLETELVVDEIYRSSSIR